MTLATVNNTSALRRMGRKRLSHNDSPLAGKVQHRGRFLGLLFSHALKPGASEKVTQLHFKGEEVFIKEVYEKVKNWWDQSEARKLKRVALEAPQRSS